MVIQSGIDIRTIKEKMIDFCISYDMENPFDFCDNKQNIPPSRTDTELRLLWDIFRLSNSERILGRFLPDGMREEESYLFDFSFNEFDVSDVDNYQEQLRSIHQRIHERKLLIHYFASNHNQEFVDMDRIRINHAMSEINFEIKACKKMIDYDSQYEKLTEADEDISDEEEAISRINKIYERVQLIRTQNSAVDIGYDFSQVFYDIANSLKKFMDEMKGYISDTGLDMSDNHIN